MRRRLKTKVTRRTIPSLLLAASATLLALGRPCLAAEVKGDAVDFARDIRPILAERCLECHGPQKQKNGLRLDRAADARRGGDSGKAAVQPGDVTGSELFRRITDANPEERMPLKGVPLDKRQIELIRRWIEQGADWPASAETSPAASDHWAFRPLQAVAPPAPGQSGHKNTTIDRFILAKLEERGLKPAPPAKREELLRRATFDLHGLPPTPQELANFLADRSPDAFTRVVDRLLASPRYGERWARHWLDIARFSESDGFEYDGMREHAWHYRDYVIRSFNEDKPYATFVLEQLAGDALEKSTRDSIAATGFLVAGPYDVAGNSSVSASLKAKIREEEMEDVVAAVSQTFLALTVNCARCHDHKFDPIPQTEYYRIKAALDGVRHGNRSQFTPAEAASHQARLATLKRDIGQLETKLAATDAKARERVTTSLAGAAQAPTADATAQKLKPAARWTFETDARDMIGGLPGTLEGGARVERGRLILDGKTAFLRTGPLTRDTREKTLEAWVALANLDQRGGGVISIETPEGGTFDAIVYGERESRKWVAGSGFYQRTKDLKAPVESASPGALIHMAVVYGADNLVTVYRNGEVYGAAYQPEGPNAGLQTYHAGAGRILLGLRHTGAGNGYLAGEIEEARLYDRALTPAEIAESARASGFPVITPDQVAAALTPDERRNQAAWREELKAAKATMAHAEREPLIYAAVSKQPEATYVLTRGDFDKRRSQVTAGAIGAVKTVSPDFGLGEESAEGLRRIRLAKWISDPKNPLPARVLVNRVWHYHFGRGIVGTPNDFGANGERPSHPELLDWLAATFLREGGSLKALHRLIMISAAYQQSSAASSPRGQEVDSEDRLLWHYPLRRLEGEAIRDAMLSLSGELNPTLGGPGFRPFKVTVSGSHFYELTDTDSPEFNRRTVYRMGIQSGKDPLLDSLDCPDPSTKTPARTLTTTPIQALGLMNNTFVQRQARGLATRLQREAGPELTRQITLGYQLALGREPDTQGLNESVKLAKQHGLASVCWVWLNSSEFLYLK